MLSVVSFYIKKKQFISQSRLILNGNFVARWYTLNPSLQVCPSIGFHYRSVAMIAQRGKLLRNFWVEIKCSLPPRSEGERGQILIERIWQSLLNEFLLYRNYQHQIVLSGRLLQFQIRFILYTLHFPNVHIIDYFKVGLVGVFNLTLWVPPLYIFSFSSIKRTVLLSINIIRWDEPILRIFYYWCLRNILSWK